MMEAIPSAPALPFGPVVCAAQELGHLSGLPTKEYLTSRPLIFPLVCQPQYWVQNPDEAVTSADVRTKYTALGSNGSLPEVIAELTTVWIWASLSDFPC